MSRFIGIRHRVKKTAGGEARPTLLHVLETGKTHELEDDNAELDWVRGTFPTAWRPIKEEDDLSEINPRHLKWRTVRKTDDVSQVDPARLRTVKGKRQIAIKIPSAFDGLRKGDVIAMSLGGSGDRLAFALSKTAEEVGATVLRLPPATLKERRRGEEKAHDAQLLAELAREEPNLFHEVTTVSRTIIMVRERQSRRMDAMKARIACEQRLRQTFIGQVFCTDGAFDELDIEAKFTAMKASDRILGVLVDEEKARIKELDRAVKSTGVWKHILDDVTGVGPAIAGRLISAIGNIERFMVEPDQRVMDELYQRSVRLEREGDFEGHKQYVKQGDSNFQTLQRAASWCTKNSRPVQAVLLEEAVECHRERSQLRHKARKKGQAKLKAFCGVHLVVSAECTSCLRRFSESAMQIKGTDKFRTDCPACGGAIHWKGVLPRNTKGRVSNWHPDARQALYLLSKEQFVRQKDRTRWGKMLLEYKRKLRVKHPEPVQAGERLLWTNGMVHSTACWKTATKFTEWLYDQWSELARKQKLAAARARARRQ